MKSVIFYCLKENGLNFIEESKRKQCYFDNIRSASRRKINNVKSWK